MKESDIIHESGSFWVGKDKSGYLVLQTGAVASQTRCTFPLTEDGKSIAVAYCDYLAKMEQRFNDPAYRAAERKVAKAERAIRKNVK